MNRNQQMASLLPFILNELLDEMNQPNPSLYDQHFGLGMLRDDIMQPKRTSMPLYGVYSRPWHHQPAQESGVSRIKSNDLAFKVSLDVQQFQPNEISVKMVDNFVVVEGKHDERQDEHGYVSRQFVRRYPLPENVEAETVVSSLSSDGVLTIAAPKKISKQPSNERVVPIIQTKTPAVRQVEENPEPKKKE